MAVVINEFEVVAQPPEGPAANAPSQTQQSPTRPLVREIEQIMRRHRERAARVRAH